jgi:hypothetical protein
MEPACLPAVPSERYLEHAALLILSLLLAALGVAVFPCWRYSARWGYVPSAAIGGLLVFVALMAAGGKDASVTASSDRLNQPKRVVVKRSEDRVSSPPVENPAARTADSSER